MPGLICGAEIWKAQTESLPNTVAIDGYGLADSFPNMADLVLEAAPERFNLVGHSMGGRVALEVYRAVPDRVLKLALLDTGVHGVREGEADKRHALIKLAEEEGMGALVNKWLPPMVAPEHLLNADLINGLRGMCLRKGLDTFKAQVKALLSRPSLDGFLETINVPTLVATGELDLWSPVKQHSEMATRIEGATLEVFDGAGHMAPAEAPKQVTKALARWMM